jgi:hypothetical protein
VNTDDKVRNLLAGLAARYRADVDLEGGLQRLRAAGYGFGEGNVEAEEATNVEAEEATNVEAEEATVVVRVGRVQGDLERSLERLRAADHGVSEENVEEKVATDGAIVVVCTDRAGAVLFVDVISRFKQRPVEDHGSGASLDNLSESNQPSDAYEEEDDLITWISDDVVIDFPSKGLSSHKTDSATQATSITSGGSPSQSLTNVIDETAEEPSSGSAVRVYSKSRSHLHDLRWITAIWAMGLTTIVVLAGVLMWCITGGAIDIESYLRLQLVVVLAIGGMIAWAFKDVLRIKKKKKKIIRE